MSALSRRSFLTAAALGPWIGARGGLAQTPAWPTRPVRIFVAFPAGNAPDTLGRLLAERMAPALGQNVVVENVPGASGNIGIERASKAPPDGYSLLLSGDAALVVNPSLFKTLTVDPATALVPISRLTSIANYLVVNPAVPAHSVAELVTYARANPGKLSSASFGIGTAQHLDLEQFKAAAGIDITHVPYRELYTNDLLGNHVNMAFIGGFLGAPHIRSGKLRALAIVDRARVPGFPDLPTIAEQGFPEVTAEAWFGLTAPAGTPETIIRNVHAAIAAALAEPAMIERLGGMGMRIIGSTPEEMAAFIKTERPRMAEVIRRAGVKVE
jgi:tripartite-type tricarboxylate transporter receptor subunit TctC